MVDYLSVMESDQAILDRTTRKQNTDGTSVLTFDFEDGKVPVTGIMPQQVDGSLIREWCAAVRRVAKARGPTDG